MTLEPTDVYLTLKEVAEYVRKSNVTVWNHRKSGVLKTTGKRVRLDHFSKYLARQYPTLKRLDTVADLDAWRANKPTQPTQPTTDYVPPALRHSA